jgi:hypothetical protein
VHSLEQKPVSVQVLERVGLVASGFQFLLGLAAVFAEEDFVTNVDTINCPLTLQTLQVIGARELFSYSPVGASLVLSLEK